MKLAIEEGAKEIVLLGATGTRLDHLLGNIGLLRKALQAGIPAYIVDEHNKLYLMDKEGELCKENLYGPYVSLLPLGECVENVTLSGFKYDTKEADFVMGETLGISNELVADKGKISFRKGCFIVVEAKD